MTKQEKIKEAWRTVWDELPEEQKQCALKYNGLVSIDEYRLGYSDEDVELVKKLNNISKRRTEENGDSWLVNDKFHFIPRVLLGLKKNNDWIKVDDSEDLLVNDKLYILCQNNIPIEKAFHYNEATKQFIGTFQDVDLKNISHFAEIKIPKPPIY